eukprot:3472315-Pleurochrysis_carterae.AAC.7
MSLDAIPRWEQRRSHTQLDIAKVDTWQDVDTRTAVVGRQAYPTMLARDSVKRRRLARDMSQHASGKRRRENPRQGSQRAEFGLCMLAACASLPATLLVELPPAWLPARLLAVVPTDSRGVGCAASAPDGGKDAAAAPGAAPGDA